MSQRLNLVFLREAATTWSFSSSNCFCMNSSLLWRSLPCISVSWSFCISDFSTGKKDSHVSYETWNCSFSDSLTDFAAIPLVSWALIGCPCGPGIKSVRHLILLDKTNDNNNSDYGSVKNALKFNKNSIFCNTIVISTSLSLWQSCLNLPKLSVSYLQSSKRHQPLLSLISEQHFAVLWAGGSVKTANAPEASWAQDSNSCPAAQIFPSSLCPQCTHLVLDSVYKRKAILAVQHVVYCCNTNIQHYLA